MSPKMRWSLWMTAAGVTTALVVYFSTGSFGWAVVGLLASGFVLNAIAENIANGRGGRARRKHEAKRDR